jgi:hypothetical protein
LDATLCQRALKASVLDSPQHPPQRSPAAATLLEVDMIPASIVPGFWPQLAPIVLLVCSNLFMTLAWYGHLKFKSVPLVTVVLVS